MKHEVCACEMTHTFGPFETWLNYESVGDTERVKANFGCSELCCARYMLTISVMFSDMSLADDAGTSKASRLWKCKGKKNPVEQVNKRFER